MSDSRFRSKMIVFCIVSLGLMAWLDFITGQELVFSCAYLIPVSLTAWWFPRRWMLAMCVASGVTAFLVDKFDGYEYANTAIIYWNASTCFVISLITGLTLARLRQTLREKERTNSELRAAMEKIEASTLQIRKLQSGLQTMCAWTQRIKVGDKWMTPDEFLITELHLKLTHGLSPEAFEEMTGDSHESITETEKATSSRAG